MIKTVIKLDGRQEPYSPDKINQWGEWGAASLGNKVDWSSIVLDAVAELPEVVSSQDIQRELIDKTLARKTWSHYLMAGKLYVPLMRNEIFGTTVMPSIMEVHGRLIEAGLMVYLDYSLEEYEQLNQVINHELDFDSPHYSLYHIRFKYSLRNQILDKEYETPQFVYMRMAMALAETEPKHERMEHVINYYREFSEQRISCPTPNYVNLGTSLRGYASCCLYIADDNGVSLATGDYIANIMTQRSAGIGSNIHTRSIGDGVRGGMIRHQGKLPYYAAKGKSVHANLQNGRGGAGTTYYSAFDPEAEDISQLSNPRSVENKRNRDLHYALMNNAWFAWKVAENEDIFTFNVKTAPDLEAAFFSGDLDNFIELYEKYEQDPTFKKKYVSARKLLVSAFSEAFETGVAYMAQMDEINRHTPFLEPIFSSNLCAEIVQPTKPYPSAEYLYRTDDHGQGEISTCNLAALVPQNIHSEEQYEKSMYYALKMIDKTTEMAEYAFPHLRFTALQRRNAGVGIMGMATMMAQAGVKISDNTGKRFTHRAAERHMWHAIGASLRIAKERGVAPWIHKTKWPQGWLPLDTYNRSVDEICDFENRYDWEKRRQEIIDQGGIAHSVLVAYMPGESSSKALRGVNNGIYFARSTELTKHDGNLKIKWAILDGDDPSMDYEIAWDVSAYDMIDYYAIWQKWTDQAISADEYRRLVKDEVVDEEEIVGRYLHMVKRGMKTRYYFNTQTSDAKPLDHVERAVSMDVTFDLTSSESAVPEAAYYHENNSGDRGCAGGACSL